MRKLCGALVLGISLAAGFNAGALIIDFTNDGNGDDDPFAFVGNANPVTVFGWLDGERLSWNNNVGTPILPDPTTGLTLWENLNGSPPTFQVAEGDYIALHYGTGTGGDPGGGFVALFFDADQVFTPNANGTGPNGNGGLSGVYLWDHVPGSGGGPGVPDGGATVMFLGGVMTMLGLVRRKLG